MRHLLAAERAANINALSPRIGAARWTPISCACGAPAVRIDARPKQSTLIDMTMRERWVRGLAKACHAAMLVVAGAWLFATYLTYTHPALEHQLKDVSANLLLALWSFWMLGISLRPKASRPALRNPSPRWSGASVVVATGIAGALFVARSSDAISYAALSAILLGTLVIAALVWRFATAHAGDIGEARFVDSGVK